MSADDLISKRTRNAFRETLVGWTLREIEMEFESEGFTPDLEFQPSMGGQRRSYVEQYYRAINFSDIKHVRRLLRVYERVIRTVASHDPDRAQELRTLLENDGCQIDERGRVQLTQKLSRLHDLTLFAASIDAPGLRDLIERIEAAIDKDPALAIGTAKELVESCCKTILTERNCLPAGKPELPQLIKETLRELRLLPDDIPDSAKGAETIKRMLSNLGAIVSGLAEMRNLYGSGHGRHGRARGLSPRHAKLAVGAASSLALFLFETSRERGE